MNWIKKLIDLLRYIFGCEPSPPEEPDRMETTLFFYRSDGIIDSTWNAMADTCDDRQFEQMRAALKERGANSVAFLTNNSDGRQPVSIYKDRRFGGVLDNYRIVSMKKRAKKLVLEDQLIPHVVLFSDEDEKCLQVSVVTMNEYMTTIHNIFSGWPVFYVLSIESNEIMGHSKANELAKMMREISHRPVGTHVQIIPARPYFPSGMDFFLVEAEWDPEDGEEYSPDQVVKQYNLAQAHAGSRRVYFHEWNIRNDSARMREQREALRRTNTWGIG